MASLTMTTLDGQRPNKRFRRCTTGDPRATYGNNLIRVRSARSSSTSSYSRRNLSATSCPNSLTHGGCSHPHSRTSSFSHSSPFLSSSMTSSSRSRSVAEARALVLDPAYSGVGHAQARVFVDEQGEAHDPDYRMFPAVPPSPRSCSGPGIRRGSTTSARGRFASGSAGACPDSPFAGSPFAGYVDFEIHYSNSASHEVDTEEEEATGMDEDEDADAESVIEWSRLHASASPPGYGTRKEEKKVEKDDGYADFAGMEWDEKEWRREEIVPVPSLDKHSPASAKGKQSTPSSVAPIQPSASNASLPTTYPRAVTTKVRAKPKSSSKAGSISSTARGYVPAKRSYDETIEDEWAPSCGHSVRRHWQSFTLRIRLTVFRWRRRLRRAFASAGAGSDQRT